MGEYRSNGTTGTRGRSRGGNLVKSAGDLVKAGLIWNIKTRGIEEGELFTPIDCAFLPKGVIAVSESQNRRIQLFDNKGASLGTIAEGKIQPKGITVDQVENTIIATCSKDKAIKIYSLDNQLIDTWGREILGEPHGIAMTTSDTFVVTDLDPSKPKVSIHDLDGSVIRQFGSRKEGDTYIENPNYVTVDQHGRIIVTDYTNHCVKVYNTKGERLLKFGSQGDGPGQLKFPLGVTVDYNDNIFVADNGNHRVSLFSQSGKFIQHVLEKDITWPEAVSVSESGLMALTESGIENDYLKVYRM